MTRNLTRSLLTLGLLAACSVPTLAAAEEWQTALKAQAKVTEAKAQKTALAKVPGGSIQEFRVGEGTRQAHLVL